MPTAVPARMYVRSFFWNSQGQDRHRVVSVTLVTALVEPDSRYSLHDPHHPSRPRCRRRRRRAASPDDRASFLCNARNAISPWRGCSPPTISTHLSTDITGGRAIDTRRRVSDPIDQAKPGPRLGYTARPWRTTTGNSTR